MFGKAIVRGLLAVAMVSCAVVAQADVLHMGPGLTSLETVWVTNPGNAADSTGYGAVGYSYRMGKYDVTAAQYTEFLNAKARTDTYGLYNTAMADPTNSLGCNIQRSGTSGSYTYSVASDWANRPVNYVCWYDCIRFANWLQNGQGNGDTETGTYTITGGGVNSGTVSIPNAATRATWTAANPHWVLPSEDEWYKAAYYDPNKPGGAGYWIYPTKSDTAPINTLLSPDPGNHANFYDYYGIQATTATRLAAHTIARRSAHLPIRPARMGHLIRAATCGSGMRPIFTETVRRVVCVAGRLSASTTARPTCLPPTAYRLPPTGELQLHGVPRGKCS